MRRKPFLLLWLFSIYGSLLVCLSRRRDKSAALHGYNAMKLFLLTIIAKFMSRLTITPAWQALTALAKMPRHANPLPNLVQAAGIDDGSGFLAAGKRFSQHTLGRCLADLAARHHAQQAG